MHRTFLVLALSLLLAAVAPVASAAAPTLRVRVVADPASVTLDPGARAFVGLNVTVEFVDYPCASGTEAGVDLVGSEAPPSWYSANINPFGSTYSYPRQTRPATLTITVAEDAPSAAKDDYRIQPVVHYPSSATCTSTPTVDAPEFAFPVATKARVENTRASDVGSSGPGSTPMLSTLGMLGAIGLGLLWLRRRAA